MNLRLKATAIHFAVSVLTAGIVVAALLSVWFPGDYARSMGGWGLIGLLIGCDVVMGPLLSLVVCDPTKSRRMLAMDYAVIVAVQLAALGYGVSVASESRPVFAVFAVDRINIVSAFEVDQADLQDHGGTSAYRLSWTGPQMVTLKLPTDNAGRDKALQLELAGGELQTMPRYYAPYDATTALARAQPLAALVARHAQARDLAQRVLQRHGLQEADVAWLPASHRFGFDTALLSRQDGRLLGFLGLDPY